jgi:diacylglycerol kinase (ATP)
VGPEKVLVILNGISARKKFFYRSIFPVLQGTSPVVVRETQYAGHAEELASQARVEKFDLVLAGGGDGTLSQVVNGIVKAGGTLPTVGLIPLGSGNDFARTVGIRPDGRFLAGLVRTNKPRLIDIGCVTLTDAFGNQTLRYFTNACSLGMGPEVVRRIQQGDSFLGPGVTYLTSIIKTFFSLPRPRIEMKTEGREFSGRVCVLAMANGKAFGHAVYIAPDAQIDDGELDLFKAGDFPVWRFLLYLQLIKSGKKVRDSKIEYGRIKNLEVTSAERVPVEADGELIGFTPLTCEVKPQALKFLY